MINDELIFHPILGVDFDQITRVDSLVGTKPTPDTVIIAQDKYTCAEVIMYKHDEEKMRKGFETTVLRPWAYSQNFKTLQVLRVFRP